MVYQGQIWDLGDLPGSKGVRLELDSIGLGLPMGRELNRWCSWLSDGLV